MGISNCYDEVMYVATERSPRQSHQTSLIFKPLFSTFTACPNPCLASIIPRHSNDSIEVSLPWGSLSNPPIQSTTTPPCRIPAPVPRPRIRASHRKQKPPRTCSARKPWVSLPSRISVNDAPKHLSRRNEMRKSCSVEEVVAAHQGPWRQTGEYYKLFLEEETGLMALVQCIYAKGTSAEEEET